MARFVTTGSTRTCRYFAGLVDQNRAVAWFDVAESPRSEKSYAVCTYPTGSWSSSTPVPGDARGVEYRGVPLDGDAIVDGMIERWIQRLFFQNTWTVRVALGTASAASVGRSGDPQAKPLKLAQTHCST